MSDLSPIPVTLDSINGVANGCNQPELARPEPWTLGTSTVIEEIGSNYVITVSWHRREQAKTMDSPVDRPRQKTETKND